MSRSMIRPLCFALTCSLAAPGALATDLSPAAPTDEAADDELQIAKKKKKSADEIAAEEEAARQAEEEARKAAEEEAKRVAEEEVKRRLAEEEARKAADTEAAAKRAVEASKGTVTEAQGLDARVRRISDALARAIKRMPGDHRDQTFAVMPFTDNDEESKSRRLGLVVSDLVLTNLARDHRVPLTERSQLNAIMSEQSLQASGAVDPAKAAEIGQLAGASAMIIGDVTDTGEAFTINARLVSMADAAILDTQEASLPKEELIAFSADAVVLRSRAGAMFRSLVAPGWGQVYNREPVKAGIVAGSVGGLALTTGGTLLIAGLTTMAYGNYCVDDPVCQSDPPPNAGQEVKGLRDTANAWYTTTAVFAGLTAVVWTLGALEAYVSGTDVESLDDALARN
jgi:TolB-like protein